MKKEDVLGNYIFEILPNSKLPEILITRRADKAGIWQIRGPDTVITRFPITQDGKVIWAIGQSVFLDMSAARLLMENLMEIEKELNLYKAEVKQHYKARWRFSDLIGNEPEFLRTKFMAQQFSHTVSTTLITGESGTGEDLFAHAIHNASSRRTGQNLLESELFSYEEGAFTGVKKGSNPGKFELAEGLYFLMK